MNRCTLGVDCYSQVKLRLEYIYPIEYMPNLWLELEFEIFTKREKRTNNKIVRYMRMSIWKKIMSYKSSPSKFFCIDLIIIIEFEIEKNLIYSDV